MAYLAVILERGLFLGKTSSFEKRLARRFLLDSLCRRLKSRSVLQERDVSRVNQISKLEDFSFVMFCCKWGSQVCSGVCRGVCMCLPLRGSCCPLTLNPPAPASQRQGFQVYPTTPSKAATSWGHHCEEKAITPLQEAQTSSSIPWLHPEGTTVPLWPYLFSHQRTGLAFCLREKHNNKKKKTKPAFLQFAI